MTRRNMFAAAALTLGLAGCGSSEPPVTTAVLKPDENASAPTAMRIQVTDFLLDVPARRNADFVGSLTNGTRMLDSTVLDPVAIADRLAPSAVPAMGSSGSEVMQQGQTKATPLRPYMPGTPALATTVTVTPALTSAGTVRLLASSDHSSPAGKDGNSATRHVENRLVLEQGRTTAVVMPHLDTAIPPDGATRYHITAYTATVTKAGNLKIVTAEPPATPEPAKPGERRKAAQMPASQQTAQQTAQPRPPPTPATEPRREAAATKPMDGVSIPASSVKRARDLFD